MSLRFVPPHHIHRNTHHITSNFPSFGNEANIGAHLPRTLPNTPTKSSSQATTLGHGLSRQKLSEMHRKSHGKYHNQIPLTLMRDKFNHKSLCKTAMRVMFMYKSKHKYVHKFVSKMYKSNL